LGRNLAILEVDLRRYFRETIYLIIPAVFIILLDQWTKWLVRTNIPFGEAWAPWPWLMPYARLVHWSNTGSAFGMFQGLGNVFAVMAVVVAGFILYYYPQIDRRDWLVRTALTLQLSGALGNLIDRIHQGFVTDFVSVGRFAVFNVADSCISVGTVLLVIGMYLSDRRQEQEASDHETDSKPPEPLFQDGQGE
jgi:signal peptidase II